MTGPYDTPTTEPTEPQRAQPPAPAPSSPPPSGFGPVRRDGFSLPDFVTFRWMITPVLITVIYVLGFIAITLVAIAALSQNALGALLIFIVGQLYLRVILELFVVLFRINDNLTEINERGRGM